MGNANTSQIEYWNGRAGEKWTAHQKTLDDMMTPLTRELSARVGKVAGQRVLDIGCGTGETCALWLEAGADVTGVDVSAPMLGLAARRTNGKVKLVQADASSWRGDAPFDLAVSRFGVMFFDAPEAAFANIGKNLRPGGRLLFVCWRPLKENPWATTPLNAVSDLLPEAPPPVPHAPGPFALADRGRLEKILSGAGFRGVTIQPFDFPVCLASAGGVEAAVAFAMQIGPTGAALAESSDKDRAIAADRLRAALAPHERGGRVTLDGAIWFASATTSQS